MKRFLVCSILMFLLFSSCSNTGNVTYTGSEGDTLKQAIKNKEEAAIWTRELESVRLLKNLRQIDSVSDSIKLNPDVMKVSSVQGEKIYPSLKDFGSLDVSEIPENIYQSILNFSDSFSKDLYSVQSYFAPSSLFSYIFFLDDLKKNFFPDGLPKKVVNNDSSASGENAETDENKEIEENPIEEKLIFNRYIIGKSYESGEEYQVPIRFYRYSDYFDVVIFISTSTNKISQIKVDRYVKK